MMKITKNKRSLFLVVLALTIVGGIFLFRPFDTTSYDDLIVIISTEAGAETELIANNQQYVWDYLNLRMNVVFDPGLEISSISNVETVLNGMYGDTYELTNVVKNIEGTKVLFSADLPTLEVYTPYIFHFQVWYVDYRGEQYRDFDNLAFYTTNPSDYTAPITTETTTDSTDTTTTTGILGIEDVPSFTFPVLVFGLVLVIYRRRKE